MSRTGKLSTTLAALALGVTALAGCTATMTSQADPTPTPTASVTPVPDYLTELPEWARENQVWLVYPDGFECSGTEGCPNDYRAFFGKPGPVLPEGVEYYEPAKHDCVIVAPLGADCIG